MKKRLMMIASVAVITGTTLVATAAVGAGATAVASSGGVLGGGPMIRVAGHTTSNGLPTVAENWSGYAVTSKKQFTFVSSEFVQPAVTCDGTHWVDQAEWVGLDGFNNGTVEQDGTSATCEKNSPGWLTPNYYAWSEMFPAPTRRLFEVKPGDVIQASVTYRNNEFVNNVTDVTTGESKTLYTGASGQARDSAEWIIERPAYCTNSSFTNCFIVRLANFGRTNMANDVATTAGGTPQKITSFTNNYPIFMIQPTKSGFYTIEKTSVARSSSSSFSVKWESYGDKIPINLG
jgi:Peptidase A4 family